MERHDRKTDMLRHQRSGAGSRTSAGRGRSRTL